MQNKKTVDIGIQYDLGALQSSFNPVQAKMRRQAKQMQRIGQRMSLAISAPIITGFGLAMKEFSEFEFNMAKVQAVSGATEKEFKALKAQAEELGRTTKFTAQQVADLELQYSKLGFSASEIEKVTKATLDLALITDEDLGRSAEVAGSTLRGFNLDASEMGRVVDVMAASFTSSALDLEKFQVSISKIAPIAYATGRSIEEVTAAESVLADTGIEASIIGTSLRKIYGDLAKEGLSYADAMKQIRNATDPVVKATELFDIRAAAAAVTLAFQEKKFKRLLDTYNNAAGTTEKLSATINDTLLIDFKELQSAVQGAAIKFGEVLSPAVRTITDLFTWMGSSLAALSKPMRIYLSLVALTAAAMPPLIFAMGAYGLAISSLTVAQKKFILSTRRMLASLGPVTIALGVVIALWEGYKWAKEKARRIDDSSIRVIDKLNDSFESQRRLLTKINNLKADGTKESKKAIAATLEEAKAKQLYNQEVFLETQNKLGDIGAYLTILRGKLSDALSQPRSMKEGMGASTKEIANLRNKIAVFEKLYNKYSDVANNAATSQERLNEAIDAFNAKKAAAGAGAAEKNAEQIAAKSYISSQEDLLSGLAVLNEGVKNRLARQTIKFQDYLTVSAIETSNATKAGVDKVIKETSNLLENVDFTSAMASLYDSFAEQWQNTMVNGVADLVGELATGIGEMIGGSLSPENFGKEMLVQVASFIQQLGGLLIVYGSGMSALLTSMSAPNPATALAAIAGGAAMVAAGAAIKGALSQGLDGGGSTGYSAPSYSRGSNYDYGNFESEVVIQGREMIIVQRREGRFRR